MKVNAFIVGAPKCGTTSLATYLGCHNDVFICDPKEPHYFSTDIPMNSDYTSMSFESQRDYENLFRNAKEKIIIDASTSYLWSQEAIGNIKRYNPDAKIIVMLRNPVDMVISLHNEELYSCAEDEEDFLRAWALQEYRKHGIAIPKRCRAPQKLIYREIAMHGKNLLRVYEYFPKNQVHVILMDDMKADMLGVYKGVLDFLGVEYDGRVRFPIINDAKTYRNMKLASFIRRPPLWLDILFDSAKKVLWKFGIKGVRSYILVDLLTKKRKTNDVDKKVRCMLRDEFSADIDMLSSIINRDLSGWKNCAK